MCHIFGVSTDIVTHILRKMCHVFGVSTDIVTHIPRKMCHVFGVSTALVTHIFWASGRRFLGVGASSGLFLRFWRGHFAALLGVEDEDGQVLLELMLIVLDR